MSDTLTKFLREINRGKLRVERPSKFVFLCGGLIHTDELLPPENLRDYLWRIRQIRDGKTTYVLAESAQQLYRDSGYSDLISFEEDIARIAAIVLVISESAGSLAELGAFCSNDVISPVLRVIISEKNFSQESFIRWGPVERVRLKNRDRVGVFPWLAVDDFREETAAPHYEEIVGFIDDHVDKARTTMIYPSDSRVAIFYDIIWCVYLADAITPDTLLETVRRIHPDISKREFRRKLYSLRVADWLSVVPYGGQDYYFLRQQQDPFQYSFFDGVVEKEPVRKVLAIRREVFHGVPAGALTRVRDTREGGQ